MALVHSTATRNTMANAFDDAVNTGSGTATLVLLTAGDVEIYSWDLSNPAFGAASGGAVTMTDPGLEQATATGTITKFALRDRDSADVLTGSAATSGADMTLDTANAVVGDDATISFSWEAPV